MAKKRLVKVAPTKEFAPNIFSKNHSISPLRMNKAEKTDLNKRYPLGRFPVRVVLNVGSKTANCRKVTESVISSGGVILNHHSQISNASDKLRCKKLLLEAGLPTPNWITGANIFIKDKNNQVRLNLKLMNLKYPIVAKKIVGMGGEGMSKIDNEDQFKAWRKGKTPAQLNQYFFEEIFQPEMKYNFEYRIGVSPLLTSIIRETTEGNVSSLGEIVCLRKRMRSEAVETGAFGRNLNLGNSYFERVATRTMSFDATKAKLRKKNILMRIDDAVDICRQACHACGLDFCAADILFDSITGEWTILELNTAPSMGNPDEGHSFTLDQWKSAFRDMIIEKIKLK